MRLILTADQLTDQNINQEIILAGEWCKTWDNLKLLKKSKKDNIPYHWDDREKLYNDFLYLDELYENVLTQLTVLLNEMHNCSYSIRFWRIIIGMWLSQFIFMYYDRYKTLQASKLFGGITSVRISKIIPSLSVVKDAAEFNFVRSTDLYNYYLFSQIIQNTNLFEFEYSNESTNINPLIPKADSQSFRDKTLIYLNRFIPSCLNRIVFVSSYLNPIDLIKLQLSMKQLPYVFTPIVETPVCYYDDEMRENINLKCKENNFESLISTTLKQHIPLIYIEGFKEMMNRALKLFPKNPRVIFTACAYGTDEGFKFWAASNVENGVKLVGTQHGFNYGAIKWHHEEDHQIKCYDKFYTWGWESDRFNNTSYLPAAKFNHRSKGIKSDPHGKILFATYAWPRYSYKMMMTAISAGQSFKFIDSQIAIVKCLPKNIQDLILVRSKNVPIFEHGINQPGRWADACPQVEFYMGNKISLYEQMAESRLFVSIVTSTVQLEAFTSNFPTLLFWSPYHEIRHSAEQIFKKLLDVEILHKSPESLASKIKDIYKNPMDWWNQPKIQEAKNIFCNEFSRTDKNWLKIWKKELEGVKNG